MACSNLRRMPRSDKVAGRMTIAAIALLSHAFEQHVAHAPAADMKVGYLTCSVTGEPHYVTGNIESVFIRRLEFKSCHRAQDQESFTVLDLDGNTRLGFLAVPVSGEFIEIARFPFGFENEFGDRAVGIGDLQSFGDA